MKLAVWMAGPALLFLSSAASGDQLFADGRCRGAYEYHFINRAAAANDLAGMEILLEGGVDPNGSGYEKVLQCLSWPGEFSSPLGLAVRQKNLAMIRLLLKAGADPNLLEGEFVSPTIIARREGYQEILKLLTAHGGR